jgi:hypothetical protein
VFLGHFFHRLLDGRDLSFQFLDGPLLSGEIAGLSATMSVKLAPLGIVIGAKGWPAYLSLTYFRNSRTRT